MRGITIIFENESIHTGNDLDLVQEVKTIGSPTVQSYKVEVPGRNGLLNLTKGLTGDVRYYNRTISLQYLGTGARADLMSLEDRFNYYHGETIKIIDDDTPGYYYEGEATVDITFTSNYITIKLTIDAYPYRRSLTTTSETVTLSDTAQSIEFNNPGCKVVPTISFNERVKVSKGGISYNLTSPNLITYPYVNLSDTTIKGIHYFTTGDGNITIDGTATDNSFYQLNSNVPISKIKGYKSLTLDGNYSGSSDTLYTRIVFFDAEGTDLGGFASYDSPITIPMENRIVKNASYYNVYMRVHNGCTMSEVTIAPTLKGVVEMDLPELELDKGANTYKVSGSGSCTLSYKEARL